MLNKLFYLAYCKIKGRDGKTSMIQAPFSRGIVDDPQEIAFC